MNFKKIQESLYLERRKMTLRTRTLIALGESTFLGQKGLNLTRFACSADYFGGTIEPFNMKEEQQYGRVDKEGYFVADKEQMNARRDAWLDDLDQQNYEQNLNFEKIRKAKEKFEKKDDDEPMKELTKADILEMKKSIVQLMNDGESVTKMIERLRPAKPKATKTKNVRKKRKTNDDDDDDEENRPSAIEERKLEQADDIRQEALSKFNDLIKICVTVSNNGEPSLYSLKKAELIDKIRKEERVAAPQQTPTSSGPPQPAEGGQNVQETAVTKEDKPTEQDDPLLKV